jgi:hypothetical protein
MWRNVAKCAGAIIVAVPALFLAPGRTIEKFRGYAQATADVATDDLTDQLSDEVRDRKVELDLRAAQQNLIYHQVNVSLFTSQVGQLRNDIKSLEASTACRKRLLAEAYPILEEAVKTGKFQVDFGGKSLSVADFQGEIDDLLQEQERESHQLQIKQEGVDRLTETAHEDERVVAEMRHALEDTAQEFVILKSRRSMAQLEAETLAMVGQ